MAYQHSVAYWVPADLQFLDVLIYVSLLVFHQCHLLRSMGDPIGTFPQNGKNLSPAMRNECVVQFHIFFSFHIEASKYALCLVGSRMSQRIAK